MKINHAIIHVFDFDSAVNVIAREEIDLEGKTARSFIEKHMRKALGSIDNQHGTFYEDSAFSDELQGYANGQRGFVELSAQIADFLGTELGNAASPASTDLLVADFEEEPDQPAADASEAEAAAAFSGRARRFFGIFLFEIKQAYMHEVGGGGRTDIARRYAILPNPSQKVQSYALIDLRSGKIEISDRKRRIAGEDRWLLADGLLQCSTAASGRETFSQVTETVEAVAKEYGSNAALAVSKAKACVQEGSGDGDGFDLDELGEETFGDNAEMKRRFREAAEEGNLPARIDLGRDTARRVAKTHKIRTDTGIEISFPAEYSRNSDFIEFSSEPNGLISIEVKNISNIENR